MADTKFSALTALTAANVATDDIVPIVDTSVTTPKKITASELGIYVRNMVGPSCPIRTAANVYYLGHGQLSTGTASTGTTAQTMALYPIYVDRPLTLDALAIRVTTLEVGATVRLGIYNLDSAFEPTTLVADYGTVSCDTTGMKEAAGSTALTPGWYAMAYWCSNHATVRFNRNNHSDYNVLGTNGGAFTNAYCLWTVTPADYSAGLPSPVTAAASDQVSAGQRLAMFATFS